MGQIRRLVVIGNQGATLARFRGPLLRALVCRGVEVHALAPELDDRLRSRIEEFGAVPVPISLSRVGMNPARDAIDFLGLVRVLRDLRPDATLSYFVKPVIYGSLAARLAGVRRRFALIEGIGYPFGEPSRARDRWIRALVERLYKLALVDAEGVFLLNAEDISLFLARGLTTREKVIRLPGIGVELERFRPAPFPAHYTTFVLLARLLWEKGIREYVAAARRLKQQHPEVRFLLIGDVDPNPKSVQAEEVRSWAEEGVVEWPGWVEDVRPWLADASVFVLPSYREGLPRSTQEALAMGRPVITTDAPGCRETVVDGENGFLVPVRDVDALVEAMRRFVERPELIPVMGAASRRLAESRFDVNTVNRTILKAMGL